MVRFAWNSWAAVVSTGFAVAWAAGTVCAADPDPSAVRDPAKYIGISDCSKCHNAKKVGGQFNKWQAGPHSRAFAILGTPESKAIAARLGIANPQASGKCLKCHSTAYNWTEQLQTTMIKPEDGVVCESCHGPAKNYVPKTTSELTVETPLAQRSLADVLNPFSRPLKTCYTIITMEDRQNAIRAGLIYPAFQSCTRCHNDQSPTWKPDRYVNKQGKHVGFDLRQNFIKIAHPMPPPN
ncbi:MAG: hypothetical protein HZC54_01660 [Verrucomicrobia bacterium]|nr:hypothetical protein [Verrucomicrobiota bacterium]